MSSSILLFGADPFGGKGGCKPRLLSKSVPKELQCSNKTPKQITVENEKVENILSDASLLAVGHKGLHCAAISATDDTVWLWGANTFGQCGSLKSAFQAPVQISLPSSSLSSTVIVVQVSLVTAHSSSYCFRLPLYLWLWF